MFDQTTVTFRDKASCSGSPVRQGSSALARLGCPSSTVAAIAPQARPTSARFPRCCAAAMKITQDFFPARLTFSLTSPNP